MYDNITDIINDSDSREISLINKYFKHLLSVYLKPIFDNL